MRRYGVGYGTRYDLVYGMGGTRRGGYDEGAGYRAWGGWGRPGADTVRAGDIMTPNPEAVTGDASLVEVARVMRDLDVGVIPVVDSLESNRLQGMVTDRDITVRAAAEGRDMRKTEAREIMTPRVETVEVNDHVRDVFGVMKRARVRRVPVVDAEGRLVGIIAQADLAVDYAGLDLQRETEVEEMLERISEPARPRFVPYRPSDMSIRRRRRWPFPH